jgi:hypothetical protein
VDGRLTEENPSFTVRGSAFDVRAIAATRSPDPAPEAEPEPLNPNPNPNLNTD